MSEDVRPDEEAAVPDDALDRTDAPEALEAADAAEEAEAPGQVAFDVEAFPGGARSAIEAVLMVVDEPVSEVALATALEVPVADVRAHLEALEAEYAAANRGFTLRPVSYTHLTLPTSDLV